MLSPHHQRFLPHTTTTSSEIPFYYYTDSSNSNSNNSNNSNSNSNSLYHPASAPIYPPSKRLKVQSYDSNSDTPSSFDCPPLAYSNMPQATVRQRLHINLQRASEPPSPVTIASTLSSHSTPSPSPSQVTIITDNNNPLDFALFDDFQLPDCQPKLQAQRRVDHRHTANTSKPSFLEFEQSWPHYIPQSIGLSKPLRQQQQQPYFHQNAMSTFGNGSFPHNTEDDDLPDLSPSRCNTSRPSISENDMPTTPLNSPTYREGHRCSQAPVVQLNHNAPKLARTVSDAVQDELFNPGIAPGTARSQSNHPTESNSQLPTLFRQAQSQHAMARSTIAKPTAVIRGHSPFRANSPFHPARTQQEIIPPPTRTTAFLNVGPFASARLSREKNAENEAAALRKQLKKEYDEMQEAPKTISPKDAYLEYNEPTGDGIQGGLFSSGQNDDTYSTANCDIKSESDETEQSYNSMNTSRRQSDVNMDYNVPIYTGNSQQFSEHLNLASYEWAEKSSSQESSGQTSRQSDENNDLNRPDSTKANDGAYSCTVHGCSRRFSTASKMSKHRREAHRHGTPMGHNSPAKSLLQGPSRCGRINPTTGKPCNTIFSRPYDLTRHEDTIHNIARQKVRCEICNDEKTFSRQDALTRHKKVKHGIDK